MPPMITFTAVRLLFGGWLDSGFKAVSVSLEWLLADGWRALALGLLAFLAWLLVFTLPALRDDILDARAEAAINLAAFKDEKIAHAQSIANIRAASAVALAEAQANAARVAQERERINQESVREFDAKYAGLDRRYRAAVLLRDQRSAPSLSPGAGRADAAGLPSARADRSPVAGAPGDNRLPRIAAAATQSKPTQSNPAQSPLICPADLICLTLEQARTASIDALRHDVLIDAVLAQQAVGVEIPGPRDGGYDR